jgi:hypothetical protein
VVERHSGTQSPKPVELQYTLEEQFLCAKTSNEEKNEDAIYIGPHYVAVIDGATSKSQRRWFGKTGGRMAALLLQEAFERLAADATIREAVDLFTSDINRLYEQRRIGDVVRRKPEDRMTASFVALSLARKEIWFVGDCQCLLGQELVTNMKLVDEINAQARALYLEAEFCRGKTMEELREHDSGREFIMPLLRRQTFFQNNPLAGEYWYAVLDGFAVPDEGLRVISVPEGIETVVLASDGYRVLKDSLRASEEALQEILRDDPLLFRKYKATKGLKEKNVSFDDRAYVKVRLKAGSQNS